MSKLQNGEASGYDKITSDMVKHGWIRCTNIVKNLPISLRGTKISKD